MRPRLDIFVAASFAAIAVALLLAGSPSGAAGRRSTTTTTTTTTSSLIVFSDGATATSIPRLRLLNVDTGATRPLARTHFAHAASWSPDGTRLVVEDYGIRASGGVPQLALISLRSGSVHRLTHSSALDESPSWSPNGRQIVFSRAPVAGSDDGLWLMNANGSGERHLTYNHYGDYCATWSPDGARIAFTRSRDGAGSRDLWLMRSNGKGQHRLLARAACAAWSPDGAQLVIGKLTGRTIPACGCAATDLYLGDANGTRQRLLVRNGGDATWSPDGTRLVFVRWQGRHSHLWLVNADGTGLRRLTGGTHSQRAPAWRP